jgi:hypothetical protein
MITRSKIPSVLFAAVLSFGLLACGGAASAPEPEASEPEAPVEASEQTELDSDAILDIVAEACPISLAEATDIKVSAVSDDARTVTFGSAYGDFSYTVDVFTGEIIDKVEPEMTEEQKSEDPIENAINACFNYLNDLEGYSGGAENIKVSMSVEDGTQIVNVTFDWDGQHWDLSYNTASGEVTQN